MLLAIPIFHLLIFKLLVREVPIEMSRVGADTGVAAVSWNVVCGLIKLGVLGVLNLQNMNYYQRVGQHYESCGKAGPENLKGQL